MQPEACTKMFRVVGFFFIVAKNNKILFKWLSTGGQIIFAILTQLIPCYNENKWTSLCVYQYGCIFQNVQKKDYAAEEYMQYNINIKYKNR